jgi:hypothetical protein
MHPSHIVAQRALEPHHAGLIRIIENAWSQWMKIPPEVRALLNESDRTRAGVIWSLIIAGANEYFHPLGIVGLKKHGTVTYSIDPLVRVRFKKMDQAGVTANFPTDRSQAYNGHLPLPECPEPVRVDVGYVLDELKLGIDQILVSCPTAYDVAWFYPLTPSVSIVPLFPEIDSEEENISLVRPRASEETKHKEATDGKHVE